MAMVCQKAIVSGKVQGVFYRKSCQTQAYRFSVAGYAKNLPNGDVEVLAIGEATKVEELILWLSKGPPGSRVDQVQVTELEMQTKTEFLVL